MPKFTEFPDVIEDEVEVYESPGLSRDEFSTSNIEQRGEANEDIDEGELNVEMNRKLFADEGLQAPADINLDDVSLGPKRSYQSGKVEETLELRIARLQREVEEVLEIIKSSDGQGHDQLSEVEQLQHVLQTAQENRKEMRVELFPDRSKEQSTEPVVVENKTKPQSPLAALEQRLTILEQNVGVCSISERPLNMVQSLDVIQKKVSLFVNGGEEAINDSVSHLEKLAQLVEKLGAGSGQRNASTTGEVVTSTALYNYLGTIETQQNLIAQIAARLVSLQTIHDGATYTLNRVHELEKIVSLMQDDLAAWNQSLAVLETKLNTYDSQSAQNRTEVKSWLANYTNAINKS